LSTQRDRFDVRVNRAFVTFTQETPIRLGFPDSHGCKQKRVGFV
jgi:hypothetical protein